MGCNFIKEEMMDIKEGDIDKPTKVTARLSKRLRKINCRT